MFGQQRKNVSHQPFGGGRLRREIDEFELSLGGGLEEYDQRGWIIPTERQDWREELMNDAETLEASGLPPEYGLPPPQVGARVGTQGGGRSVYGTGNRRPPRRATPVQQPHRIRKTIGGDVHKHNRENGQGQLRAGGRTPGTGTGPGAHRRNGARVPRRFERFIWKVISEGFPEDAMRYYLQELTDQDEPKPSNSNNLEQILREDATTLDQGPPRETWTPQKFLGKGGYGDVMLWQRQRDNGTFDQLDQLAVKNTRFDDFFKDYSSEAHLTRRLNVAGCKNVIEVYDWAALEKERRVRIIYAFYPLGDICRLLEFYYKQRLVFPEAFLWHVFYNIATSLCFCARGSVGSNPKEGWEEIVHSDLKPQNILMDSPDPEVNLYYPNLRLADFGMSYTIPNEMIRDFKRKYGVGGTPGFTAPEMRPELHGDPQVTYPFPGSHSDVHSLGDTMMEFMRCAKSRYPSHAVPLLLEGLEEGWGWDYWPYSEELTRLVDQCRAPDGRNRPGAYGLYLTTKKKSESMLAGQTALEQRAQADISARGLTETSVLFTQEMQAKYRTSDRFRDRYHRRTDWFNRHRVDFNNLCDVARNPRPPPPGYVAIGNGLQFARIPDYPNPQGHRRRGEPGPRESYISLNDQQGQTLPANVRAAGEVLQGSQQTKGFGGKVRNFFSRMRRTGR